MSFNLYYYLLQKIITVFVLDTSFVIAIWKRIIIQSEFLFFLCFSIDIIRFTDQTIQN